jgi:hypothetical protein
MLQFKSQSSALGVRPPVDTIRQSFTNRATTGTNRTVVGGVYAVDRHRAGSGVTTLAQGWTTIVASAAGSVTTGVLVVAEQAKLVGEVLKGVLCGPTQAKCYGALTQGGMLVIDTTNARFIATTDMTAAQAFFEGTTRTATDALTLSDVMLFNNRML